MFDFTEMVNGAVKEFTGRIEEYAGAEVRHQVMEGVEQMPGITDPVKGALDYKLAIERLDELTDKPTRSTIMRACGRTCQSRYDQGTLKIRKLRQQYATEEEFLDNMESPDPHATLERRGKDIIQHFKPGNIAPGLRCACMFIGGLPQGTYASPTVCECARGFTEQRWETILGRPVEVEIVSTTILNDTDECTCIIHL